MNKSFNIAAIVLAASAIYSGATQAESIDPAELATTMGTCQNMAYRHAEFDKKLYDKFKSELESGAITHQQWSDRINQVAVTGSKIQMMGAKFLSLSGGIPAEYNKVFHAAMEANIDTANISVQQYYDGIAACGEILDGLNAAR